MAQTNSKPAFAAAAALWLPGRMWDEPSTRVLSSMKLEHFRVFIERQFEIPVPRPGLDGL